MTDIAGELVAMARETLARIDVPPISRVVLPRARPVGEQDADFGLIALRDGSTGVFYAWLGETMLRLSESVKVEDLHGVDLADLVEGYPSPDPAEAAIGLGAIAAISQHVFRRAGLQLPPASGSMAGLDVGVHDHVGMVGLFPSLVKRLRARGVRLTVIEQRTDLVQREDRFEVSLDPRRLADCTRVLCTASTLLNHSLEGILEHCGRAGRIALIGPTAGCFSGSVLRPRRRRGRRLDDHRPGSGGGTPALR